MKILIMTLAGQRDKIVDNQIAEHLRAFYNHEVHVHNYAMAGFQSVPYLKPDVVISPFPGGEFKNEFVRQCKEWGIEVIVRRGEAGMGRDQFEDLDEERKGIILGNWDYGPYVDLELVWGWEFASILTKYGHAKLGKVVACGAFAFDAYFVKDIKIHPERKKTILFATGFSCADTREQQSDCGLPVGSEYHKKLYDQHTEAREKWIEAIKELARNFGNEWDFKLKVRPGEQVAEYVKQLGSIVQILKTSVPSIEALRETDILVHSGSTMAIEAHLLAIPSINYCNVNPDPLLSKVSPATDMYEELEFMLSRAMPGQTNIHQLVLDELIDHLYGPIDGKACERAAIAIQHHITPRLLDGAVGWSREEIKTNIPDEWPNVARFLTNDVRITEQEGDIRWLCPVCKKACYAADEIQYIKCPVCGVSIKKMRANSLSGVD